MPDALLLRSGQAAEYGFNSPFEEFAIAQHLGENGVPTVYIRAIYMTGSGKGRAVDRPAALRFPPRCFCGIDGKPILREDHNYITLRGYFNGPDWWVAQQTGQLCRPFNLEQALATAAHRRAALPAN